MNLAIFRNIVDVNSLEELHHHLLARHNTFFGSFWLWHNSGTELSVMVNRDDSYLLFSSSGGTSNHSTLDLMTNPDLPRTYTGGGDPLLYSSYSQDVGSPDEEIEFLADNYESTPMPRLYTVPLIQAIGAIDEFFGSGERSKNIEWLLLEPPPLLLRKPWWRFW